MGQADESNGERPVDQAMDAERPEKEAMRGIWLQEIQRYNEEPIDDGELLYVTLSGAEGRDLKMLVDCGVIELTEIGSISSQSQRKIAAVESSPPAVLTLQRRFPGLEIIQTRFGDLVKGDGLLRFPERKHMKLCCARITNLDLNCSLVAVERRDTFEFPTLIWIRKLGEIHAAHVPDRQWCVYLTLHGEIPWPANISAAVQSFLRENFELSPDFARHSRLFLGEDLYGQISSDSRVDFAQLDRIQQQQILMILVPKKIAHLVIGQNWLIETCYNLRYGRETHAPMVSWVFQFSRAAELANTPTALYRRNLGNALQSVGYVDGSGRISPNA